MSPRKPREYENYALLEYYSRAGGRIIREVPISVKSIDAIRIAGDEIIEEIIRHKDYPSDFDDLVSHKRLCEWSSDAGCGELLIEIIEVGPSLNYDLFGQLITKRDLFIKEYPFINQSGLIICEELDPDIKKSCESHDIGVKVIRQSRNVS